VNSERKSPDTTRRGHGAERRPHFGFKPHGLSGGVSGVPCALKVYAVQRGVATQFLTEDALSDSQQCR